MRLQHAEHVGSCHCPYLKWGWPTFVLLDMVLLMLFFEIAGFVRKQSELASFACLSLHFCVSRGQTLHDRYFTSQTGGVLFRLGCHRDQPAILFSLGIIVGATPVIALAIPCLSCGRAAEDSFGLSLVSTELKTCLIFIYGSAFEREP